MWFENEPVEAIDGTSTMFPTHNKRMSDTESEKKTVPKNKAMRKNTKYCLLAPAPKLGQTATPHNPPLDIDLFLFAGYVFFAKVKKKVAITAEEDQNKDKQFNA